MPRSLTRSASMTIVLNSADPEVMRQIVRLIVLFEDLKVEMFSLSADQAGQADECSTQYRMMYFLRRAWATLDEMQSAFHKLNMLKEFKRVKRKFHPAQIARWEAVIKFFADGQKFLHGQRNVYGGHFHDDAAKYVIERAVGDFSPALLEIKISDDGSYHLTFKYAQPMVSMALHIDRGEAELDGYLRKNIDFFIEAMKHATQGTQLLADFYVLPYYGWGAKVMHTP
jgi:hypothetical protein